ncbi:hypothetical protein EDB86DRAFT_1499590 [Lactarius hatsudake]|nr:hypothetical protein EDB86DRAFT_1499590 [Lactarius hatsudake]
MAPAVGPLHSKANMFHFSAIISTAAGKDIFTANMYLAEDRVRDKIIRLYMFFSYYLCHQTLCWELVSKRGVSQPRRWPNCLFSAAIHGTVKFHYIQLFHLTLPTTEVDPGHVAGRRA